MPGPIRSSSVREDIVSTQPVYVSNVRIERVRGPLRRAYLPAEEEAVLFGVHSEIAAHYGLGPDHPGNHAATLDYVVAAAAG